MNSVSHIALLAARPELARPVERSNQGGPADVFWAGLLAALRYSIRG